jgi:hypothetical protein
MAIRIARRYIKNVAGNPVPNYPGLYGYVALYANGKPDSNGQPTYYDIIDDGTYNISAPSPKYICNAMDNGTFFIEVDKFSQADIAHDWSGWPDVGLGATTTDPVP